MKKYCFLQVSDRMLNPDAPANPADKYFKALWPNMAKHGYYKPDHCWEIPTWIAELSYALSGQRAEQELYHVIGRPVILPEADIYFASVLECNKEILARIVRNNPDKRFVLGGYISYEESTRLFGEGTNAEWYDSIEDFIHIEFAYTVIYRYGTCYDLFRDMKCIPRLSLSDGCSHNCKFCSIDNEVKQHSAVKVLQQAESMQCLDFELVYINDKTFGQAPNYRDLKYLYNTIKKFNPKFRGFTVQTSVAQIFKFINNDVDLNELHIVNVEIGVESYNNHILKKYNKPQTTMMTNCACHWILSQGLNVIPNIIIGLPGEDIWSYSNTLEWLNEMKKHFHMLNVTNFVPYYGSDAENIVVKTEDDLNQTICERSWHTDKEAAATQVFTEMLFEIGMEIIERKATSNRDAIQDRYLDRRKEGDK